MQQQTKPFPRLETQRLILCEQNERYASQMAALANIPEISQNLSSMPYPYVIEDAHDWIAHAKKGYEAGELMSFAIIEKSSGDYMGNIDIMLDSKDMHGTLGYWLGKPYWGKGYMSEAAREMLRYGFEVLGYRRMYAVHFKTNPASGRVMEKIGMQLEGIRRQHFKKGEIYYDLCDWGILREEF